MGEIINMSIIYRECKFNFRSVSISSLIKDNAKTSSSISLNYKFDQSIPKLFILKDVSKEVFGPKPWITQIYSSKRPDSETIEKITSRSISHSEFGYNRKDVLLIGAALISIGYFMSYVLQIFGIEAGLAGNWAQLTIFLGICICWVSTYFLRVARKNTTYSQQLKSYEEAVIARRLEEIPEAELEEMITSIRKH